MLVPVPALDPGSLAFQPLLISASSPIPPTNSSTPSPSPALDVSSLLLHFASPGTLPPSARVDPTLGIDRPDPPVRLWHAWKYGWLVTRKGASVRTVSMSAVFIYTSKGFELTIDVLSYHIRGPRRKTWGVVMTILNSLARDGTSHSHLFNIVSRSAVHLELDLKKNLPLRNSFAE